MTVIQHTFTTPEDYIYDPALVEVAGGVGTLKDISPTGSTCAAVYTDSIDLLWGDGVTTGVGVGSPIVTAGQLDLTGPSNQYVDYDADLNADSQQVGCMRMDYYPNYSGNPSATQFIFGIFKAHNVSANSIQIHHNTDGTITLRMKNSAGGTIVQASIGAWSPTAGTKYVLELNWNLTSGSSKLYINGVQFGSTRAETGTRDGNIGLLRIGQHVNGTNGQSDFLADNLVCFPTVQHTSNHASELPYDAPIKYSLADPTIVTNSSFRSTSIRAYAATVIETGLDKANQVITGSGQDRRESGGVAADSNGTYAESSTAAELNSVIEDIITIRKTVTVKTFLHSEYGNTTPSIDLISLTYNAALEDPTLSTLQEFEGFIFDNDGPVADEDVLIRPLSGFLNNTALHIYEWRTVATTSSSGHFVCDIYIQPTDSNFWEMKVGTQRYKIQLEDLEEGDFSTLTFFEVSE